MKKLLTLFFTIFLGLLHAENVKKLEMNANPINVAVVIAEKGDSTKVASVLDYYGYTLQATVDGYHVMKDSKGNEIRYSYENTQSSQKYPTVIVTTKESPKEIDARLHNLQFKKVGNVYEHMINHDKEYITQCYINPHKTLKIKRIKR